MTMQKEKRYQFITEGNETISYILTSNDKPKLLLVHGNYSGANHWLDVIEKLKDQFSLLVPDLRGYGESTYQTPIRSLEELALDVKELLIALDWHEFDVIGWSLGGGVAMELAVLMPENVRKLVLSASLGVQGYPMYEFDMETFQPIMDKPLTTYEQLVNNPIYVYPIETLKKNNDRDQLAMTLHAMSANVRVADDFMDIVVDTLMQQRNLVDANYALLVFNVTNQDTPAAKATNKIDKIKADVLLLHGLKDQVVLPVMAQLSKEFFKDQAELILFEEAGHALHSDQWEKWSNAVLEFLGE